MTYTSVTFLHLRSLRYLPVFLSHARRTARQAERSAGFLGGKLLANSLADYWTLTVWDQEDAMKAYRNSPPHGQVMHKLKDWCDGAAMVHWAADSFSGVPEWQEVYRRFLESGKILLAREGTFQTLDSVKPPSSFSARLSFALEPSRA